MARNTFQNAAKDKDYKQMLEKIDMKDYLIVNQDKEILDIPISRVHPAAIISCEEQDNGSFIITVENDWSI